MEGIIFVNFKISSLPYSLVSIGKFTFISGIFYYLALYCGGKLLVVKPSIKILVASILLSVSIVATILYNLPYVSRENKITFYENSSLCQTMLQTENGKIYLVNPKMFYSANLKKQLMNKNIKHIDGIILLRQEDYNLSFFLENIAYFSPTIYVGDNYYGDVLFDNYGIKKELITSKVIDETIKLEYKLLDERAVSCLVRLHDKKMAFFSNNDIGENYKHFLTTSFDFELNYARIYHGYDDAYDELICSNLIFEVPEVLSFAL